MIEAKDIGLKGSKPPLQFFNTETKQKEFFKPLQGREVKMYTCGPTVYHYVHIGNLRTFIFEDILRRTLKFFDYQVVQAMNLTDVDDKTIKGAIENNVSLDAFTEPFINAFFVDIQTLGIERVENYPRATQYINTMIDFIQKLLDKGIAYKSSDNSIYYSIDKFPRYGCLSHLKLEELKVGAGDARAMCDEYEKDNVSDFVLWKAYDPQRDKHIYWESPFGRGRPGWHLECSAMAISLLGETIDIHVGGVDNIFPHHENEIAQSEAYSGKSFVKLWMHAEHLLVEHKKMSKSLGNFYTLRDLLDKGYTGTEVRYMLMHTHYRTQLNFTFDGMLAARASLQRLNDFKDRMQEMADVSSEPSPESRAALQKAMQQFMEAMANDLNISSALAALFDVMRDINALYTQGILTKRDGAEVVLLLQEFNRILAIFEFENTEGPPAEVCQLLEDRMAARKNKDFAKADACRKAIEERGYVIEDTPKGPRLKKR